MTAEICSPTGEGVRLRVRLTPKSSRDEIGGVDEGPDGPVLKAKVRALPDKGQANKALIKLISKWVEMPQGEISLVSGHKSRFKTISILGNTERLLAHIDALIRQIDEEKR